MRAWSSWAHGGDPGQPHIHMDGRLLVRVHVYIPGQSQRSRHASNAQLRDVNNATCSAFPGHGYKCTAIVL